MSVRLVILAFALTFSSSVRAEVKKGDVAADFEQRTFAGGKVKLSSLRGKVVLVDFWASWCEPCKKELPLLAKMAARLKPRGIEIVAVNIDDEPKNAEAFLRDHDVHLTVVADRDKSIVGKYAPPKMPTSFVVDRGGVVRAVNDGFEPSDAPRIESQLLSLANP
jgi:thiol-disulfide isomerase/thioredoxin